MGGLTASFDVSNHRLRITPHASIAETIASILTENGGDFQDSAFTADTLIIFEYRRILSPGKYIYAVKEYELADCPSLTDYVNKDAYISDFMGEYE